MNEIFVCETHFRMAYRNFAKEIDRNFGNTKCVPTTPILLTWHCFLCFLYIFTVSFIFHLLYFIISFIFICFIYIFTVSIIDFPQIVLRSEFQLRRSSDTSQKSKIDKYQINCKYYILLSVLDIMYLCIFHKL